MGDLDETELVTGSPAGDVFDEFGEDDEWDEALAKINMEMGNSEDIVPPPNTCSQTYEYDGVKIEFPYKAYLSQQKMMRKIIEGVTTGRHCLLESPTGTGKTAALLCALLAWQQDCYRRFDNCAKIIDARAEEMGGCQEWCGLYRDKENTRVVVEIKRGYVILVSLKTEEYEDSFDYEDMSTSYNRADVSPNSSPNKLTCDAKSPKKMSQPSPRKKPKRTQEEVSMKKEMENACDYCIKKFVIDRSRPPRIYYCTRTHSQIAQVVKQLKGTSYKNVPMTILAGREPTCINERAFGGAQAGSQGQDPSAIVEKQTLDDQCKILRDNYNRRMAMQETMKPEDYQKAEEGGILPEICSYFKPIPELTPHFKRFQENGAFDLEDIRKEGMDCQLCPYFGSYSIHASADIIFGSYNYLLHPDIRRMKNIKYANSVLVFDEAHNIEDICRTMFSFKVDCEYLDNRLIPAVELLLSQAHSRDAHVQKSKVDVLIRLSELYRCWSEKIKAWGNSEVQKKYGPKSGSAPKAADIRTEFGDQSLNKVLEDLSMSKEALDKILEPVGEEEEAEEDGGGDNYYFDARGNKKHFNVSSRILSYVKGIRQTLKYLYHEETEDGVGGMKDFKGFVTGQANPGRRARPPSGGISRRSFIQQQAQSGGVEGPEYFFQFEIICLNPAVGFRALRNTAYSIIVASGTLTPLNSFASELATNFAVKLQAEHVIPKENVWAGVITTGPSQITLRLVKQLQEDVVVQDDLGKILVEICMTVPNGILVFFPSYTLLRKLLDRWRGFPSGRGRSILDQITTRKYFFQEESKDKQAFKLNMDRYKELVKGSGRMDGCILFAVFRGKISEGIDFADEQARAVVTIGIPFSNAFAAEISSKRSYNNMRVKKRRPGEYFLTGSEWYTIQAFRAMNQGFGRCVRHCNDWGALVLIDSRLADQSNGEYISGWVKNSMKAYESFGEMKGQLEKFVEKMKQKKYFCQSPISSSKRAHITPVYEIEDTEKMDVSGGGDMNSQDDDLLTQIVTQAECYNLDEMATQNVTLAPPVRASTPIGNRVESYNFDEVATQNVILAQPVRASTPINDSDVSNVAESSSEHSFGSEIGLGMGLEGPVLSPVLPDDGNVNGLGSQRSSSPSVFENTRSSEEGDFNCNDDEELREAVEQTESSFDLVASQERREGEEEEEARRGVNRSEIFDVSMPSEDTSRVESSLVLDVSYQSDL